MNDGAAHGSIFFGRPSKDKRACVARVAGGDRKLLLNLANLLAASCALAHPDKQVVRATRKNTAVRSTHRPEVDGYPIARCRSQ
jgi:hypothetical protein